MNALTPPNGNAVSARRAVGVPVREQRPARRAPERQAAILAERQTLQEEYETSRDQMPESLADSRTAELLKAICQLDVELPPGVGRD